MVKHLSDDELSGLTPRAAYEAGKDVGIDAMREDNKRNRDFIEAIHAIIREMGFRPLGLSYEQEILLALRLIAEDRSRR